MQKLKTLFIATCLFLAGCGAKVTFADYSSKAQAAASATQAFVNNRADKNLFEEARKKTAEAVDAAARSDFDQSESAKSLRLLKVILDGNASLVAAGGDLTKPGASSPESPLDAMRSLSGIIGADLKNDQSKLSPSPKP
jgi:hypothetical protein